MNFTRYKLPPRGTPVVQPSGNFKSCEEPAAQRERAVEWRLLEVEGHEERAEAPSNGAMHVLVQPLHVLYRVQTPPPRYNHPGILSRAWGLQAQRERAVEGRLLEVEGREERASRREQVLLDREREVSTETL